MQDLTVEMWTKWVAGGSDWAGPIAASQDDGGTERGWNIQTRCKDPSSGSTVSCAESRRIEFSLSTEKTDDGDGAMAYLGYPGNAARCTFAVGEPIFAPLAGEWTHFAWSYDGTSMKAYVDGDGRTRLFRPEMNMRRMNRSAARLCLPAFDGAQLLECIKELLRVDKEWIPTKRGYSMYLRPVIFSTTPWLGLVKEGANERLINR